MTPEQKKLMKYEGIAADALCLGVAYQIMATNGPDLKQFIAGMLQMYAMVAQEMVGHTFEETLRACHANLIATMADPQRKPGAMFGKNALPLAPELPDTSIDISNAN